MNVSTLLFAVAVISLQSALMPRSSPAAPSVIGVDALSQSIVVVGLNAALQKRFVLPPGTNLAPGNVHRADAVETGVGGKGQDVGVALSCLISASRKKAATDDGDEDGRVLLAQFLGAGPAGDAVSDALRTRHRLSPALTVRNAAPLRTCTTIVGADEATELVETSGEVTADEMAELEGRIADLTREGGKADCVCVMGSMPPGCADGTYAELTRRLADGRSLVLIDSVIGLDPLLDALASIYDGDGDDDDDNGGGGAVLKLNAVELCKLAGVAKSSGGEADRVTLDELTSSARGFASKYSSAIGALDYLCVTDGRHPGYLVEMPKSASRSVGAAGASFRMWQLPAVDLSNEGMLYPIGAGDTVAAGTLAAWQYLRHHGEEGFSGVISSEIGTHIADRNAAASGDGDKMATAFAFGLACGSASCLQPENSVFDVDDAVKFFNAIEVKPVVMAES